MATGAGFVMVFWATSVILISIFELLLKIEVSRFQLGTKFSLIESIFNFI